MLWHGRTRDQDKLPRCFLQKPDQFVEFRALFLSVAARNRRFDTVLGVVFKDQLFHAKNSRPDRGRLGQDIHAVAVAFDHLGDTAPDLLVATGGPVSFVYWPSSGGAPFLEP